MNTNWRRDERASVRPSGKAFSFRLTDAERAKLEAAVHAKRVRARDAGDWWQRKASTVGSFVKAAALAAAELEVGTTKPAARRKAVRHAR